MTTFKISYEPTVFKFKVDSNHKKIVKNFNNFIETNQSRDISTWIEALLEKAIEETNNEKFVLQIDSCFDIDKSHLEAFFKNYPEVTVDITYIDSESYYKQIDNILESIESKKSNFHPTAIETRMDEIKKLKSTIVEIPVIATMSRDRYL